MSELQTVEQESPPRLAGVAKLLARVERKPERVLVILALGLCALAMQAAAIRWPDIGIDFAVFRRAAERVLAGEAVYRDDGAFGFKYAPLVALMLTPLGLVPPLLGYWLWNVLNALAYAFFLGWLASKARLGTVILTTAAVAVTLQHHFALGQIDMLIFAGVALSERIRPRSPLASGAVLGLLGLVKLPFLLLCLLPLHAREWRRLGGVALGIALVLLAPALHAGLGGALDAHRAWLEQLSHTTAAIVCLPDNQGAFALPCLFGLTPGTVAFSAAALAAGTVVALLLLLAVRRGGDPALCALLACQFLSPLGWYTGFVGSVGLFALAIDHGRRMRWLVALVLLVVALASREILGGAGYRSFLELRVYGIAYTSVALIGALASAGLRDWHRRAN